MPSSIHQAQLLIDKLPPGTSIYLSVGLVGFVTIYACVTGLYRLCFSPLAGFPGPKIAAATGWYEFYFDVIKGGKYIYEIEKMHRQYGIMETLDVGNIVLQMANDFQVRSSGSTPTS